MPAGQGKDAERFAAAVESGTPLDPADDAELARELEIVAMLRSQGAAFAPDAETKARAKQRLMAVLAADQGGPRPVPRPAAAPPAAEELTAPLGRLTEREDVDPAAETRRMDPITAATRADGPPGEEVDSESDTAVEPIPLHGARVGRRARHSLTGRARRPATAGLRGRVVFVGAAAAAVMLAIASGGVLASSDALPGDSLYPVKRVAESAGLALTFDDASRARRYLELAATRLSEVEQLAHNTQAEPAPEVFTAAMDDFDASTDEGSRLMLEAAESDEASTATDDLHTWASKQSELLTELEPELPASADADASIELLERLLGQTGDGKSGAACDEDDCDSDRSSDEDSSDSDATDATEDATSTSDDDSADASETDEPSPTPTETSDRDNPGLLPDLSPDASREDDEETTTSSEDEDSTSTTSESDSDDDEDDDDNVSVPLPLLPPVTLPPLLPGMPGITIG